MSKIFLNQFIGMALIGEVCIGSRSTALVRDSGGFSGIVNAAHELGHL